METCHHDCVLLAGNQWRLKKTMESLHYECIIFTFTDIFHFEIVRISKLIRYNFYRKLKLIACQSLLCPSIECRIIFEANLSASRFDDLSRNNQRIVQSKRKCTSSLPNVSFSVSSLWQTLILCATATKMYTNIKR